MTGAGDLSCGCGSAVHKFSFECLFFFLNTNSPVQWVDCLQPLENISEYGRESQVTFVSSSAFTDLLQTPTKGEMDPLTLKSRGKVLYFSIISMDLTDQLRKERWEGV